MLFENITILDEEFEIRTGMFVGVRDDRIAYVGASAPTEDFGARYPGEGRLLMPGFFNCHAHSPMTLLRGYGENLSLQDWLETRIFPFEAKLDGDAVYWGMMLAIAESLRAGIVSTTDMYYFCEDMARAVLETGVKNNLSRGITNFTGEPLFSTMAGQETAALFEGYNGLGEGRLRVDLSLHAEYTTDEGTVRALADYSAKTGAGIHVHVSETLREHEECKSRHGGLTPSAYLDHCGLFDRPTTAAHCVWLEEGDFHILQEKGVTVAANPVSNIKLASGVCNVPKLMDFGINVALGTDSVASNNSLNFLEEIKFFALLPKGTYHRLTSMPPEMVLQAATRSGAISQGRPDSGILRAGAKADLVVVDLRGPHMHPAHDLRGNLVYSASGSDILLTMIDGKVLYRDGEYLTLDIERVIFETERSVAKILAALA